MDRSVLRKLVRYALLLVLGAPLALAQAATPADIGVVVVHGKWDRPQGHVQGLANYLAHEGFAVVTPEMPWSGERGYDKGAAAILAELDTAIDQLKAKGARKVVLAGHSQGAIGALYCATQRTVDGIALIAAGGHPQAQTFIPHYAPYVATAKHLVEEGKGDEAVAFVDLNTGNRKRNLRTSARTLLDYFDPEGPLNSVANAKKVKPGTAVLVVIPERETEGLKRIAEKIRDQLPATTKSTRVAVDADHLGAPDAAKSVLRNWMLDL